MESDIRDNPATSRFEMPLADGYAARHPEYGALLDG